ncbi:hypothetical protein ASPVEDRAFT_47639 [Aspergillus versicolor CBS 583.65]|uniref:Extracellular membrane protein CFEM domain-containing protein n=1 Tax=Aspergillus versicolor CBS 583.65 TaxID=1036611 RepID=A0A1L9Q3Z3_ASPVE|nr:uncharacterized protein ASPVEDRAFT_47639 [Aspergillus versicolor CBS 583.65]OJJ08484.1 hypothetical protein ASPVEDRAFT_47639 [Aspergillus versicolor CBS 583.65]
MMNLLFISTLALLAINASAASGNQQPSMSSDVVACQLQAEVDATFCEEECVLDNSKHCVCNVQRLICQRSCDKEQSDQDECVDNCDRCNLETCSDLREYLSSSCERNQL